MDNDRDLVFLAGKTPEPPAPAQHEVWKLRMYAGVVGAYVRPHQLGYELRVELDGRLLLSTVYLFSQAREMSVVATEHRAAFEAQGWTPRPRSASP